MGIEYGVHDKYEKQAIKSKGIAKINQITADGLPCG